MKTEKNYFIWIFFMIIWIYLLINLTTDNQSLNKASAELNFYQSTDNHPYNDENLYYSYSSSKYPLMNIYKKVKVTLNPSPSPIPVTIYVNNITVHSH